MLASNGEVLIHRILEENDVPFEEEYEFDDLMSGGRHLRFDFAVFDDDGNLDFLIEYNGIQHYRPSSKFGGMKALKRQQYNDGLKRQYCLKNRLRLVTIPYIDESRLSYDYIMRAAGY